MGDLISLNTNVPAHLQGGDTSNDDLSAGASLGFPIISYMGRAWAVMNGNERTEFVNDEGDPKSAINVVIVAANANMSKVYYAGKWVPGSTEAPTC